MREVNQQTFKVQNKSEGFSWSSLLTKPIPKSAGRSAGETASEILASIQKSTGKKYTEQVIKMVQEEIQTAEDLARLTD